MTEQPYVPPADDGGDQGAFTLPQQALAQPNAQDPKDRGSVGSLWNGVKDQARACGESTLPGRSSRWISFAAVWKAQSLLLGMTLLFSGLVLLSWALRH